VIVAHVDGDGYDEGHITLSTWLEESFFTIVIAYLIPTRSAFSTLRRSFEGLFGGGNRSSVPVRGPSVTNNWQLSRGLQLNESLMASYLWTIGWILQEN
jgi:hypothetical protein